MFQNICRFLARGAPVPLLLAPLLSPAAPVALREDIAIRHILDTGGDPRPMRIDRDPLTGDIYYVLQDGDVFRLDVSADPPAAHIVYTSADTGVSLPRGFAFGPDGTMFLLGETPSGRYDQAVIRKGVPAEPGGSARVWSTLATTELYPGSQYFSHGFNGIAVSPDGLHLFVNSGSRTEHGEVEDNRGTFPGAREVPLTSAIFRLPVEGEDLLLENDEAKLREAGYFFADGVRNSFDLAFNAGGDLFAAENSGDRDDSEELNWIREGRHYGFPWRMGTSDTPMQFEGYDPENDPLLPEGSFARGVGLFYDDPAYPPPPEGTEFTDPIPNLGPDADLFRDPESGEVIDASDAGVSIGTFTGHRSPLGLVFDTEGAIAGDLRHGAFVLAFNRGTPGADTLLAPFGDPGEDLLHLDLTKSEGGYELRATRIAAGFDQPVDAVLAAHKLYVIERGGRAAVWEVSFPSANAPRFRRGLVNSDDATDISDPIFVLLHLFRGATISCADAADADDNGKVEISDAILLLHHLFGGERAPEPPRERCGEDPTPDDLGTEDDCRPGPGCGE